MKSNQGEYTRNVDLFSAKYDNILVIDLDDCLNTDPRILHIGTNVDCAIQILLFLTMKKRMDL